MGIGEAEAFSERLKRELQALEAANVHAILESEPLVDEVILFLLIIILKTILVFGKLIGSSAFNFLVYVFIFHVFQVLHGLEAATNIVDDMDEWLGIFNIKLRHMREDIESVGLTTYK